MKINFLPGLFAIAIIALFSCTKPDVGAQDSFNPNYTLPSGVQPVQTTVLGYVMTDENDKPLYPIYVALNNHDYLCTNGMLNTGTSIPADKYYTKMAVGSEYAGYYQNSNKTFPVTSSLVNYVSIKTVTERYIDFIANSIPAVFNLGGGATASFGTNTLWQPPQGSYPGEHDPSLWGTFYANYYDPTSNDFANRLPCYNMGDDGERRKFLKSFGVIRLQIRRYGPYYTKLTLDNNKTATVKIPIPASLLSNAPDVITKWKLQNNIWIYGGDAKKSGNYYEAQIDSITTWNFAIGQDGVYKTVRVRTDSGASVINTGIRVKSGTRILTEAQTDADGNAICFIPANEDVTIEVVDSWAKNSSPAKTVSVPASSSEFIDITLSALSPRVITMKGDVINCSGAPIASGMIILKNVNSSPSDYLFPFKNGKYNIAMIYTNATSTYTIRAKSFSNEEGVDTAIHAYAGTQNRYVLNTCAPTTNLFMNFSLDGVNYSILGDMSHPYSPFLNTSQRYTPAPSTFISATATTGPIGAEFAIETFNVGVNSSLANLVIINRVNYFYDYHGTDNILFTRYDLLVNGYVLGSVDCYVKDAANVSHHFVANFKLRRSL